MSAPVDVLAVMDAAARSLWIDGQPVNHHAADLISARAAVAELIEASTAYAAGDYHDCEVESRSDHTARRYKERQRLEVALARVKGGAA